MFKSKPDRLGYNTDIPNVMYYAGKALEENLKNDDYDDNPNSQEVHLPPIKINYCKVKPVVV